MKIKSFRSTSIRLSNLFFLILFFTACKSDKWKEIEIISPDEKDTISVITFEDKRYIYNGNSDEIPENDYALVSLKEVTEMGDEIGICWNKDGYKWKLQSFYSEIISNNLDSTKYVIQGKKTDERGIPDHQNFFKEGCVVIYHRDDILRPVNGAKLRYK